MNLEESAKGGTLAEPILLQPKRLMIAHPHGFCAGVSRAVEAAEELLRACPGETVYCLNEIVHNQHVVAGLRARGMVFVGDVAEVPAGGALLLPAHGVAPEVVAQAQARQLRLVDATCPFVMRIHAEVRRFSAEGIKVICIGKRAHDEVIGVVGEAPGHVMVVESPAEAEHLALPLDRPVAVVTQTTLGEEQVEEVMVVLRRRFPKLLTSAAQNICYATRNRQQAVRQLARECEFVLVLGSRNSSNSQRLAENARAAGAQAALISDLSELAAVPLDEVTELGLTSGASTPESFLMEVVAYLREHHGFNTPQDLPKGEETRPSW